MPYRKYLCTSFGNPCTLNQRGRGIAMPRPGQLGPLGRPGLHGHPGRHCVVLCVVHLFMFSSCCFLYALCCGDLNRKCVFLCMSVFVCACPRACVVLWSTRALYVVLWSGHGPGPYRCFCVPCEAHIGKRFSLFLKNS